jgi:hypothetical protein
MTLRPFSLEATVAVVVEGEVSNLVVAQQEEAAVVGALQTGAEEEQVEGHLYCCPERVSLSLF